MFAGFPVVEIEAVVRRTLRAVAGLAAVALAASVSLGAPLFGLGVLLGLALGVANSRLFQLSAARFTTPAGELERRSFTASVLGRLGAVTAVALVLVWLVSPLGWGVIVGVAGFQLVLLLETSRSVLRGQRQAKEQGRG